MPILTDRCPKCGSRRVKEDLKVNVQDFDCYTGYKCDRCQTTFVEGIKVVHSGKT